MERQINPVILEEAAAWFVEIDGDEEELSQRKAFDAWLRRSPEHVRAFLELLPIWERGAVGPQASEVEAEELIAWAIKSRANVVSLPQRANPSLSASTLSVTRAPRLGAAFFSLVACAALAAFGTWKFIARDTYSTDVGEQRSIALSDGSLIDMNARSKLRVRMDSRERTIELMEGQAIFRVARDKSRPFIVRSGETSIRAVGTEFDVYRRRRGTTVTVLEGRVAVSPQHRLRQANDPIGQGDSSRTGAPVLLSAGEQLEVMPAAVPLPRRADLAAATAWTERQLMFQKTPLGDVADEFNRYNAQPLRIEDAAIRNFLISGTFSSTDPSSLLRFLREQPGIRVVDTGTEILIESGP